MISRPKLSSFLSIRGRSRSSFAVSMSCTRRYSRDTSGTGCPSKVAPLILNCRHDFRATTTEEDAATSSMPAYRTTFVMALALSTYAGNDLLSSSGVLISLLQIMGTTPLRTLPSNRFRESQIESVLTATNSLSVHSDLVDNHLSMN